MIARNARPKLSLCTSAAQSTSRQPLSLKSPSAIPRTPISPASPSAKRFSSFQVPSYAYSNSCSSKSILKKHSGASSHAEKRIKFKGTPTVHCVTPIENPEEYYGTYTKLSREERRWMKSEEPSDAPRFLRPPRSDSVLIQPIRYLERNDSSGDDTSVAIVEKESNAVQIHFLDKVTCDTSAYQGIHPVVALESHQENIASLVHKALAHLPVAKHEKQQTINVSSDSELRRKPDFVCSTRGPGFRSNLFVGLDTGKALSVAWQVPFVGVHHMQAHLLTPRLVSFKSSSITDHEIMASTVDRALGEALDKAAREIIPPFLLQTSKSTMYGKLLEEFAFPNGKADYADYQAPKSRHDELIPRENPWGWSFTEPWAHSRQLQYSFCFIGSTLARIFSAREAAGQTISHEERIALAREAMRTSFEHLASRTIMALESLAKQGPEKEVKTLVVSGGVAANQYLMTVLRSWLDARGFGHVGLVAPPPYLCTDNAAMIAWAGMEMFEAGWRTNLTSRAIRKWSLDPREGDGGVLGPFGWERAEDHFVQ
ncbi:Mitochondrial carrier family protein [Aspergillus niger]|uniref:N(6)-L-threonylcarbamoyladenine synthase n=1 Tax=Aspergillus niger TaxID=5061 RepID=A0A505I3K5_ASPNG|nr:Mitochondrial carrier family protein [Aspergillus niger]